MVFRNRLYLLLMVANTRSVTSFGRLMVLRQDISITCRVMMFWLTWRVEDFFIYTMNSDGTLTRGRDIGYDYPSGSKLRKVIPIDEHRRLLNIDVSDKPNSDLVMECESFVVHERGPGKYELAERIDGLFYPVHSLASLPGGRFLVDKGTLAFTAGRSVDFRGNVIDDPLSSSDERDVLDAVSFIDDVESLKENLDRIIESGN